MSDVREGASKGQRGKGELQQEKKKVSEKKLVYYN